MKREFIIGIDVGGTFTDAFVSTVDGKQTWTGKSPTTYGDLSDGLLNALSVVAEQIGVSLESFLGRTVKFSHGTTVVTNVVAQMSGSRVGLLTTKGFRDLLMLTRSARGSELDPYKHERLAEVLEPACIAEVNERIDYKETILVPLNEADVEAAVRHLVEQERIEALAICFLWSFARPDHERRARDIVKQLYPKLYVSISSDIHPVIREYDRGITTVLNCYCGLRFAAYAERLEARLRDLGLHCRLLMMSSSGGAMSAKEAAVRPISLVSSGPAGGLYAAVNTAKTLNHPNLLATDMGGTSYDVSLVVNGSALTKNRAQVANYWTGLSVLDINSIGAGGGSIAWADKRGMVRVGPRSAGSEPGCACYDKGGTLPTVTDAAVVLGLVDPNYFLGGKIRLRKDLAEKAFAELGEEIGQTTINTAAGVYRIVCANMANAARQVTIGRGHDPRDFVMLSFGGCGPLFAAPIARELSIRRVLVPERASVFSAYGCALADVRRERSSTVRIRLPIAPEVLNQHLLELMASIKGDLTQDGIAPEYMSFLYEGDFQYVGQMFSLTVSLQPPPYSAESAGQVQQLFQAEYARRYGRETMVGEAPIEMLNLRVIGYGRTIQPDDVMPPIAKPAKGDKSKAALKGERAIFDPLENRARTIPIYEMALLTPGIRIVGPSIIERLDTSILVPKETEAQIDNQRNVILSIS